MSIKEIILHIAKRLGIALFVIGIIFGIWYFSYDSHKLCEGNKHLHTDGGLGLFVMIYMISLVSLLFIAIETIVFYFTNRHKKGHVNLLMLLLVGLLIGLLFL